MSTPAHGSAAKEGAIEHGIASGGRRRRRRRAMRSYSSYYSISAAAGDGTYYAHTEMIQAISALNLLLNLFLNSGAESMVQQE
jgi:hypothetical protein